MLYTSVPLERVYHDFNIKDEAIKLTNEKANESDREPEYKEFYTEHGRIHTKRTKEGYLIDYVNSTDMKDYLNEEYSIGKLYQSID